MNTKLPNWLPKLIELNDFGGNWEEYFRVIYESFKKDFIDSKPIFRGKKLGLKRFPLTQGKEATFWHMTSEGQNEEERTPDLRRCERINWPKPIIENDLDENIKVWKNKRGSEARICLWFEAESYLVILTDRGNYILPWTAYLVEQEHSKRKLNREYQKFLKSGETL